MGEHGILGDGQRAQQSGAKASAPGRTRMQDSLFTRPKQRQVDRILKVTLKAYNIVKIIENCITEELN